MKKYNEYKDSRVVWIGCIPTHWVIKKLSYHFNFNTGFTPPTGNSSLYDENGHNWITISDMKSKHVSRSRIKISDLAVEGKRMTPKDSLLYSFKLSVGKLAFAEKDLYTNEAIFSIYPNSKINLNYYYYLLSEILIFNSNKNIYGANILNQELIKSSRILVPPKTEQQKIVTYLDHKTQKLDQLIEIKEKKIALLKEKRTALINHAITKGLDSSVEMKDSGVEWIGGIPKHWEMKRVKYLFEIRKRISGELGYDVLSITQKGIKVKDIVTGKGQLSMDYRKYQIVEPMDFAMNHMDLLTGFVDVSKHLGVTSPDYRVFTLVDKESSHDYYLFLLQFGYINKVFYGFGQGSSMFGRWRLPAKEFLNFYFPYPSLKEQKAIVKYLNEQFDEIDKTIEFEQKKIDLLKEYRKSLISDVVTGKIRVCEEDHSIQYETH